MKYFTRMSSKLSQIPKKSTFTSRLKPDQVIKTPEIALKNERNIIHTPRILESGAFSYTLPEERKQYKYLTSSPQALKDLGLDPDQVNDPSYQKIVSGEAYKDEDFLKTVPFPYSQAYAGWQFGSFAGQLGDGRVTNLFEVPKHKNDQSRNRNVYEVQLKGSGLTPFSRFADGKAVIRSSIREYIISEHLNSIGISTTRALALTFLPETRAKRYMYEKCGVVARFAELWVRLGSFDLYRMRGNIDGIKELSDYCIEELFTLANGDKFPIFNEIMASNNSFLKDFDDDPLTDYDKLFFEIVIRNAQSTAKWQTYGFLNGVLNTDNTSVLGLSMDYGPFSIMDKFQPNYTPNSEDLESRYGYRNTPTAIWWNLTRLGEDMAQLFGDNIPVSDPHWEDNVIKRATKVIEAASNIYTYSFTKKYVECFYNRLGLSIDLINKVEPDEQNQLLIAPLLKVLEKIGCDFNRFFVKLQEAEFDADNMDFNKIAELLIVEENMLYSKEEMIEMLSEWLEVFQKELKKSENLGYRRDTAKQYNPLFLPRNWILDEVIDSVESSNTDDLTYLKKLEKMAFNPYDSSKWGDELKDVESKWLQQGEIGEKYSMLQCSCSS